jgi:hypothetical protein
MFAISLVWRNLNPNRTEILKAMSTFPASLTLDQLFTCRSTRTYVMKGLIMFGMNHYVSYIRLGRNGTFYKFNDERVDKCRKDGDFFDFLVDAMTYKFRPVVVLYENEEVAGMTDSAMAMKDDLWLSLESWALFKD